MKFFGNFLFIIGLIAFINIFDMDTTVSTGFSANNIYGLPERVINLSLASEKQTYLILSALIAMLGLVLVTIDSINNRVNKRENLKYIKFNDIQFIENDKCVISGVNTDLWDIVKKEITAELNKKGFEILEKNSLRLSFKKKAKSLDMSYDANEMQIFFNLNNTLLPDYIENNFFTNSKLIAVNALPTDEYINDKQIVQDHKNVDKLIQIKEMLDKGLINEEEFLKLKKELVEN